MHTNLRFTNRQNVQLSGVLHQPNIGEPKAFALFAHCFTCTKSIKAAVIICETLAQHGIATMRFDFTGLGGSKGAFSDSNFSTNVDDLIDAANFLEQNYAPPQLLVGHSLGGTAILAASQKIESAKAVASIGSPSEPEHILHLLEAHLTKLENDGEAEVELAGRPFTFKQSFVSDVQSQSIDYRKLRKALMVMHSPIDDTVSIDEAAKIFSRALHPKSFVTLDDADHLLQKTEDAQYAADVLSAWCLKYIDFRETEDSVDGVVSEAATNNGFLTAVQAGRHHFIADEPKSYGGKDLGPTPYDFLGAALGTCTAMTLNMYARHKKLNVDSVKVDVQHSRIHASDCEDCEKTDGKIDVLTRLINIQGDLEDAQRQRMLEIADRCPVHRTLENEIKVVSKLS